MDAKTGESPVSRFADRVVAPPEIHLGPVEPTAAASYLSAYRVANLERLFSDLVEQVGGGDTDLHAALRRLRTNVAEVVQAEDSYALPEPSGCLRG